MIYHILSILTLVSMAFASSPRIKISDAYRSKSLKNIEIAIVILPSPAPVIIINYECEDYHFSSSTANIFKKLITGETEEDSENPCKDTAYAWESVLSELGATRIRVSGAPEEDNFAFKKVTRDGPERQYKYIVEEIETADNSNTNTNESDYSFKKVSQITIDNPRLVIVHLFKKQLLAELKVKNNFTKVYFSEPANMNEIKWDKDFVKLPNGFKPELDIPEKGSEFKFEEESPRMILFISNLKIRIERIKTVQNAALPSGGQHQFVSPVTTLTVKSMFVLWDNHAKVLVSFGFIESVKKDRSSYDYLRKETWVKTISNFVNKLMNNPPFLAPVTTIKGRR